MNSSTYQEPSPAQEWERLQWYLKFYAEAQTPLSEEEIHLYEKAFRQHPHRIDDLLLYRNMKKRPARDLSEILSQEHTPKIVLWETQSHRNKKKHAMSVYTFVQVQTLAEGLTYLYSRRRELYEIFTQQVENLLP
jgi:hypothetical protein